jgi:uncharacterized damage-inducible protein DinB
MLSPEDQAKHDKLIGLPAGNEQDSHKLLLAWLNYHRGAILRKAYVEPYNPDATQLISDDAARKPIKLADGRLIGISILGLLNHLTHMEKRWVDGVFLGLPVEPETDESRAAEFNPGPELSIRAAVTAYQERAEQTNSVIAQASDLNTLCRQEGYTTFTLFWVIMHLDNETARHAGHNDIMRQSLDGLTGE